MHIALLEDESTLAQEVSLLLTKAGHSVVVFADFQGPDAICDLQRQQNQ